MRDTACYPADNRIQATRREARGEHPVQAGEAPAGRTILGEAPAGRTITALREAIRQGSQVWIGYLDSQGNDATRRRASGRSARRRR
ncbi:hypothetical protein [Streptosporangium sp. NPDC006930]|uniref:hypothetical protein n=1 Tax=Streptosporangium sp. NPDC006930 TaxID=3154783 RepID=UPI0034301C90